MKGISLLCTLALASNAFAYIPSHHRPAPLNKDGTVADTPEVAAARHDHLARLAKAGGALHYSHNSALKSYDDYDETPVHTPYHGASDYGHPGHTTKWTGPPAPLNHDGTVAETPEVKHAKAVHFAVYAETLAHLPRHDDVHDYHSRGKRSAVYGGHYQGPPAPLNHDGTVAETPEVKAVKSVHLAAHATLNHGRHHSSFAPEHHGHHHDSFAPAHHEEPHQHHAPAYHNKHFVPAPLNHDGTVAETPEIKAAKAVHFAAHQEILHKYPVFPDNTYDGHYEPVHNEVQDFHGAAPYHGNHFVPAPLNHDGTVAETPEVHARRSEFMAEYHKALARLG